MAEGAGKGPCGETAATGGERVVERGTAERQVRARIPMERGVLDLFPPMPGRVEPVAHRETLSVDPCVSWCECVALVRHLVKLQEAGDAKANHSGRGVMNAMDERDEEKMAAKAQKYWSHLAWMTAVRDQVAFVETDNIADLVLSQGGMTTETSYGTSSRSVISVAGICHRSGHSAAATWCPMCCLLPQRISTR